MIKSQKAHKIFLFLCFAVYLSAFLLAADYCFYRIYVHKLIKSCRHVIGEQKNVKYVDALTLSRLGDVQTGKKSSFVNFAKEKRKGIIRIGCLGDSFTYGDDVGKYYDYPSLLQDIFMQEGYTGVEVINFGSSWYGFGQTYMMWDYVAKDFDLDHILLGPMDFLFDRDIAFNHTYGSEMRYLHSRFILKAKGLELIDVAGATEQERIGKYYGFIPALRYIRFDANMPSFLACALPRRHELKRNPFYYHRGDITQEAAQIEKILLAQMSEGAKSIILGHYTNEVVDSANSLHRKNILAYPFHRPVHFPYLEGGGHNSPCGNYLVARQMFDAVTGKKESRLEILKTRDLPMTGAGFSSGLSFHPFDPRRICFKIDGVKQGSFMEAFPYYQGAPQSGTRIPFHVALWRSFLKALLKYSNTAKPVIRNPGPVCALAIKNHGASMLDAFFLPLNFKLEDKMTISVCYNIGGKKLIRELGPVQMPLPEVGLGSFEMGLFSYEGRKLFWSLAAADGFFGTNTITGAVLLLNGSPVINAVRRNDGFELIPLKQNFLIIRAGGDSMIDVKSLNEKGVIYLCLSGKNGQEELMPFAEWFKTWQAVPLEAPKEQ